MAGQSSQLSKAEATALAKGTGCPLGKPEVSGKNSGKETQLGRSGEYNRKK